MKKLNLFMFLAIAMSIITASCSPSDTDSLVDSEDAATDVKPANPYAMDIDEAQDLLEQILAKTPNKTRSAAKTIKSRFTLGADNRTRSTANDEHPTVHVFNFDDNGGFAIMSADKRTSPILALTESGEITPEMRTDNFGLIVALKEAENIYKKQLAKSEVSEQTRSTTVNTENGLTTILSIDSIIFPQNGKSLLTTEWDQSYPYNKYCPMINYSHAPAGCVPVAVAQIMAYYQYPNSYNGYSFNWSNMKSDNNCDDTARLLQQLGLPHNLNVSYSLGGSSAHMSDIPHTLQGFGYTSPGDYADFDFNIIWQQINLGAPVIVSGNPHKHTSVYNAFGILIYYDATDAPGHAWIACGTLLQNTSLTIINNNSGEILGPINSTNYFLYYNFGWGGAFDGYYISGNAEFDNKIIDNVTDNNGNTFTTINDRDFIYNLKAIINIVP